MCIMVVATSAMLAHIAAHLPMPLAPQASAHIVEAWAAAEHASMHDCIMVMSMPIVMPEPMSVIAGMAFIMSLIIMSTGEISLLPLTRNPVPNVTPCYICSPTGFGK